MCRTAPQGQGEAGAGLRPGPLFGARSVPREYLSPGLSDVTAFLWTRDTGFSGQQKPSPFYPPAPYQALHWALEEWTAWA